ncbi:MAG: hypothetical protein IKN18_05810 [Neisseriaceae bacterium]|nr:hypothetical protein [Neisseriaceae bacterium]
MMTISIEKRILTHFRQPESVFCVTIVSLSHHIIFRQPETFHLNMMNAGSQ